MTKSTKPPKISTIIKESLGYLSTNNLLNGIRIKDVLQKESEFTCVAIRRAHNARLNQNIPSNPQAQTAYRNLIAPYGAIDPLTPTDFGCTAQDLQFYRFLLLCNAYEYFKSIGD